jgi:integrase
MNQPTLADVIDILPTITDLPERARKELASHVRSFCRLVDVPPNRVTASTPVLRELALRRSQAAKPVSHRRWSNILSGLRTALHLTGILQIKFRLFPRPADGWRELLTLIPCEKRRIVFLRFARYCTAMAIIPGHVDDAVIGQFRNSLEEEALTDPRRKIVGLCRAWNKAAGSLPGWPRQHLTVPHEARTYGVPWLEFPMTLLSEVEHYLTQSLAPDPLDPDAPPPVRISTIVTRRQLLRDLASARVNRGTPVVEIRGLADLVRPEALRDALYFFIARYDNKLPRRIMAMAILARSIARNFLKLPEFELVELDRICKPLSRRLHANLQRGLTAKNRRRLLQFLDHKNTATLLNLPLRLHARAKRSPPNLRNAFSVQIALAIELFITTLLRSSNIRCLSYSRHFVQVRQEIYLLLSAQEVKNSVDLEIPLPRRTAELLRSYMEVYQPLISRGHSTDRLFPGVDGQAIGNGSFTQRITDAILKETGFVINVHLFRHLGAHSYLSAHHGDYESARRFLGHKSTKTTTDFYLGLETIAAFRRYDEVVLQLAAAHDLTDRSNKR